MKLASALIASAIVSIGCVPLAAAQDYVLDRTILPIPEPPPRRLVDAIKDMGQHDNTLIFYELGDNGASAEGGMSGLFNGATSSDFGTIARVAVDLENGPDANSDEAAKAREEGKLKKATISE